MEVACSTVVAVDAGAWSMQLAAFFCDWRLRSTESLRIEQQDRRRQRGAQLSRMGSGALMARHRSKSSGSSANVLLYAFLKAVFELKDSPEPSTTNSLWIRIVTIQPESWVNTGLTRSTNEGNPVGEGSQLAEASFAARLCGR